MPAGLWTNQLESLPAEIGMMTNLQVRCCTQAHLLPLSSVLSIYPSVMGGYASVSGITVSVSEKQPADAVGSLQAPSIVKHLL